MVLLAFQRSAATTVNWVGNLIISLTFLDLCKAITTYGAFWLYGAIAVAGWLWLYIKLLQRALPLPSCTSRR